MNYYAIEEWHMTVLRRIMDRLYRQDRLSGDDMRDGA